MRTFLLLPFLLVLVAPGQNPESGEQGSQVTVIAYKWSKSRQVVEKPGPAGTVPAPAMTHANKNFERNRRINASAAEIDPNSITVDGRAAAIEKSVQSARAGERKEQDVFAYRARIQNAGGKVVEIIFWEYQFTELANPSNTVRRQFLCGVNIKPNKEKELQAFSLSGPSDVISIESLASKSGNLFDEKVVINRIEYTDGSIWQRKDWNYAELRPAIARAVATPWGTEMCRGL